MAKFIDTSMVPLKDNGSRSGRDWGQAIGMQLPITWRNNLGKYVTITAFDNDSHMITLDYNLERKTHDFSRGI